MAVHAAGSLFFFLHCSFLGNVTLGRDVSVAELQQRYDGVVLAYGMWLIENDYSTTHVAQP